MAEVDLEKVRMLAESAQERADKCHKSHQEATTELSRYRAANGVFAGQDISQEAASHLNDYFYWIGHAHAYKGIVAMAELQTVVEDELDAEGSCP